MLNGHVNSIARKLRARSDHFLLEQSALEGLTGRNNRSLALGMGQGHPQGRDYNPETTSKSPALYLPTAPLCCLHLFCFSLFPYAHPHPSPLYGCQVPNVRPAQGLGHAPLGLECPVSLPYQPLTFTSCAAAQAWVLRREWWLDQPGGLLRVSPAPGSSGCMAWSFALAGLLLNKPSLMLGNVWLCPVFHPGWLMMGQCNFSEIREDLGYYFFL